MRFGLKFWGRYAVTGCAVLFLFIVALSADAETHFSACSALNSKNQNCPQRSNVAVDVVTSFLPHVQGMNTCYDGLRQRLLSTLAVQKIAVGKLYECAVDRKKYPTCANDLKREKDKLSAPMPPSGKPSWEMMREGLAMWKGVDWNSPESAVKGIREGKIKHPFGDGILDPILGGKAQPALSAHDTNEVQNVLLEGIGNVARANCSHLEFKKYQARPVAVTRTSDGSWIYKMGPTTDDDGSRSKLLNACMTRGQLARFSKLPEARDASGKLRVTENLRFFFPYNYLGAEYPTPVRPNYFLEGTGLGRVGQWDAYFKTSMQDHFKKQYWAALAHGGPIMAYVTSVNPSDAELAQAFKKMSSNISDLGQKISANKLTDWDMLKFGGVVNQWLIEHPSCCDFANTKAKAGKIFEDSATGITTAVTTGIGAGCMAGMVASTEVAALPCAGLGMAGAALDYSVNVTRADLERKIANSNLAVDDLRDLERVNELEDRAFWSKTAVAASVLMDTPALVSALRAVKTARAVIETAAKTEEASSDLIQKIAEFKGSTDELKKTIRAGKKLSAEESAALNKKIDDGVKRIREIEAQYKDVLGKTKTDRPEILSLISEAEKKGFSQSKIKATVRRAEDICTVAP